MTSHGKFIVFEGGEGTGKTTQIKVLEKKLTEKGFDILVTREPGGTGCPIAEEIRAILKNPAHKAMTAETELFLFLASRAQHVRQIIQPAINEGKIVICDRYQASTLAYQHYARGLFDLETVKNINCFATGDFDPDLTLLFDIDPEVALNRIIQNQDRGALADDRFDNEKLDFHRKVRQGFLNQTQNNDTWKIINAAQPIDDISLEIWRHVGTLLQLGTPFSHLDAPILPPASRTGGSLEVICGSMFAGKTEELIRRLKRSLIAQKKVKLFKPSLDTRFSATHVVSHDKNQMESIIINRAEDIFKHLNTATDVIGIDEAQFFDDQLPQICDHLANTGFKVIVAGLDTTFDSRPFGPIPELLALAESVTKLGAICSRCGTDAVRNRRKTDVQETIGIGGAGEYEPLCRQCFNQVEDTNYVSVTNNTNETTTQD
ncbi:TPA: hypothetical protein DF272_05315 [Candidatus Falkowbacteria bacterium]|nr:hypothetical protein [Candidatus Falkowbacteria bacterium]